MIISKPKLVMPKVTLFVLKLIAPKRVDNAEDFKPQEEEPTNTNTVNVSMYRDIFRRASTV